MTRASHARPDPLPDLAVGRVGTPLGGFLMVWDGEARLWASDFEEVAPRIPRLLSRRCGALPGLTTGRAVPVTLAQAITAYFDGEIAAIDALPVCWNGTEFQNRAWKALRDIPAGRPLSYGEQAARLGNPKAARAIGSANQANPYSLILPCHRLIGANGALTGYAGGLERKEWLLAQESRGAEEREA